MAIFSGPNIIPAMPNSYQDLPAASEFNPYYGKYIALVPPGDIFSQLERQAHETAKLLAGISAAKAEHRYAPGKWSIKEVVGHLADAERIFTYRALRFARGDANPLHSFDENAYVPAGEFGERPLPEIAEELRAVRNATLALFRGLPEQSMSRTGVASDALVSVRALAWITAGHELHHVKLLRERYLA